MKFYIWYEHDKYSGISVRIQDTLEEVLAFVNERTDNPDFKFNVIEGREIKFKAVEVVKKYIKE